MKPALRAHRPPAISTTRAPPAATKTANINEGNNGLYHVNSSGTLEVELQDGLPVVVSPKGALVTPRSAPPVSLGLDGCEGGAEGVRPASSSSNGGASATLEKGAMSRPMSSSVERRSMEANIRFEDLKIGHIIGQGSQAIVRKVKHVPTGIVYAMKIIDLHGPELAVTKILQRELSRLAAASHPNIVSYREAYFFDNHLKLLMEYVNLGSLSSLLRTVGPLPMGILTPIVRQVMSGLNHLHESGILHRDLKPSNLLINRKGVVKISDFGVSTMLSQQGLASTQIGSTAYMSPERIRGDPHGPSSDFWSLGVAAAECALGVFPFRPDTDFETSSDPEENPFTQHMNMFDLSMLIGEEKAVVKWDAMLTLIQQYVTNRPAPEVSDTCKDFVSQCMQQKPADRPSARQLVIHPFLTETIEMPFGAWLDTKEQFAAKTTAQRSSGIEAAAFRRNSSNPALPARVTVAPSTSPQRPAPHSPASPLGGGPKS